MGAHIFVVGGDDYELCASVTTTLSQAEDRSELKLPSADQMHALEAVLGCLPLLRMTYLAETSL